MMADFNTEPIMLRHASSLVATDDKMMHYQVNKYFFTQSKNFTLQKRKKNYNDIFFLSLLSLFTPPPPILVFFRPNALFSCFFYFPSYFFSFSLYKHGPPPPCAYCIPYANFHMSHTTLSQKPFQPPQSINIIRSLCAQFVYLLFGKAAHSTILGYITWQRTRFIFSFFLSFLSLPFFFIPVFGF